MKVRRVVELLYQTYDPEQEIMAVWFGSEMQETKAGVWETAVEIWDSENPPTSLVEHVKDIIIDAEISIELENERAHAELAIDTYLHDLAEAGLDEKNV